MRVVGLLGALLLCVAGMRVAWGAADWPEWPVYPTEDAMTSALSPTGADLHWTTVTPEASPRLFLSNHPETWIAGTPEGKLCTETVTATTAVNYRLFFQHYNYTATACYLGLVIENLSDQALVISGDYLTTGATCAGNAEDAWQSMKNVGKRNAYAELSGKLRTPLTPVSCAPQAGERRVLRWKIKPGDMLGGRMWLTVRRAVGDGPVQFRISTVRSIREEQLTGNLPLIALGQHHPRGAWPFSAVTISNDGDPFDLGQDAQQEHPVRNIRICQPVYENGVKVRYTDEVVFTKERSAVPEQSLSNNGMYGAIVNARLCVKNSGPRDATVGLYLRYPVKDLPGAYVGAATTYKYDETRQQWEPDETKAVDLSNLTYTATRHDWWLTTRCLASYPIKAGETREIPLTLTNDGPAMLPLAIVLRKE